MPVKRARPVCVSILRLLLWRGDAADIFAYTRICSGPVRRNHCKIPYFPSVSELGASAFVLCCANFEVRIVFSPQSRACPRFMQNGPPHSPAHTFWDETRVPTIAWCVFWGCRVLRPQCGSHSGLRGRSREPQIREWFWGVYSLCKAWTFG